MKTPNNYFVYKFGYLNVIFRTFWVNKVNILTQTEQYFLETT